VTDLEYVNALWQRAKESIRGAEALVDIDPNAAASRSYYAAFHAVSALFGIEGRVFKKHSEVLASVHRDLVHAGRWPLQLGAAFSHLNSQRRVGDYGAIGRISRDEAIVCVERAKQILEAVRRENQEAFSIED
jgi:uncharacterized protein (UPF0332 family)